MKHLARIQTEFIKLAFWDTLSREQQEQYLKEHPASRKQLTATVEDLKRKFNQLDDRELELKRSRLTITGLKLGLASYRRRQPLHQRDWVEKQLQAVNEIIKERTTQRDQKVRQELKDQGMLATVSADDVKNILKDLDIQEMSESPIAHGTERGIAWQYFPGYYMTTAKHYIEGKPSLVISPDADKQKFMDELDKRGITYKLQERTKNEPESIIVG